MAVQGSVIFPVNQIEMKTLEWEEIDFALVTGDTFMDHSSCGAAIIARVLAVRGYRIGIISQPNWKDKTSVQVFGRPRLGFLVTAGNLDSMVSHYTVNQKRRNKDMYTAGGTMGKRPNRAVITYCNLIRSVFSDVAIIIGGIEASLRRFTHYDYWQDRIRKPILADCGADLLVYGMGEKAIVEIAEGLEAGLNARMLTYIRGTGCMMTNSPDDAICLPSYQSVSENPMDFAKAASIIQGSNDPFYDHAFVQEVDGRYFVQNPAQMPLTEMEMDDVYDLPFTGQQLGGGEAVPGFEEVRFSITANRGCYGSCSFCALAIHQGRYMQRRSKSSILKEVEKISHLPGFKGYIHDIGGPTANFLNPACEKQSKYGVCRHRECLFPEPCPNLNCDESDYCDILKSARQMPGVKKVFVRSGIRYDVLLEDHKSGLLKELTKYHISGQLRVAPEHCSDPVLEKMGKPSMRVFNRFEKKFNAICGQMKLNQYIVPYFISSHPGSTLQHAIKLSEYFRDHHAVPEQVQDFYPTPGSLATAMYYSGLDPKTLEEVYVPKGKEKQLQRALLQFNKKENQKLVREALIMAGREDLIGNGPKALVPMEGMNGRKYRKDKHDGEHPFNDKRKRGSKKRR